MEGPTTWIELLGHWGPYWALVAAMGYLIWYLVRRLMSANECMARVIEINAQAAKGVQEALKELRYTLIGRRSNDNQD